MDYFNLSRNWDKWRAVVNTVMNIKWRGTVRLKVLGFICGVAEVFDLLGCFTASVGSLLLTFRNMEQNFHFLNTRR